MRRYPLPGALTVKKPRKTMLDSLLHMSKLKPRKTVLDNLLHMPKLKPRKTVLDSLLHMIHSLPQAAAGLLMMLASEAMQI